MNGIFKDLEDQIFFVEYVTEHFSSAPGEAIEHFPCQHVIDKPRIEYAHGEYVQSIKEFSLLLSSENPDHYKRAGALLQALVKAKIVTSVEFSDSKYGSIEDFEQGIVLGYSYNDAQEIIKFPNFYREFHNELLSFDLAFLCCWAYEEKNFSYDFPYLHSVCDYLVRNDEASVDSLAMIFRSFMR